MRTTAWILTVALLLAMPSLAAAQQCASWPDGRTLQQAVNASPCVEVDAGDYVVSDQIVVPPGHTLRGAGMDATRILANPAVFPLDGRAVITAGWSQRGATRTIEDLTVHGSHVAVVAVGFFDFRMIGVRAMGGLCAGVIVAGPNASVEDSVVMDNAWPTNVPGRGWLDCTDNEQGGFLWGGGIYLPAQAGDAAPRFIRTIVTQNYGPGFDVWGGRGGLISDSRVYGNVGWAGVHLYEGASNWRIERSTISHSPTGDAYPHPECYPSSSPGQRGAAVRICKNSRGTAISQSFLLSGFEGNTGYAVLAMGGSTGTILTGTRAVGTVRLESGSSSPPPSTPPPSTPPPSTPPPSTPPPSTPPPSTPPPSTSLCPSWARTLGLCR